MCDLNKVKISGRIVDFGEKHFVLQVRYQKFTVFYPSPGTYWMVGDRVVVSGTLGSDGVYANKVTQERKDPCLM